MKNYLVSDGDAPLGLFEAETPGQAGFLAASARVDQIGNRVVELVVTDGESRTTVRLEPKVWYQVAEVSESVPIAAA